MQPSADRDALVVAMTLVPGLYSRNRMFQLFKDPQVKRARTRASLLRGVVRQLVGSHGDVEVLEFSRATSDVHDAAHAARHGVLRFRIPPIRLVRAVELSDLEAACVAYLCARAGVSCLHPGADDRAMLDAALRRLSGGLHLDGVEGAEPAREPPV